MRWSASKYLARIAERLPEFSSHEIVEALLATFDEADEIHPSENAWQGACLALAEFARRDRIPEELVGPLLDCVLRVRRSFAPFALVWLILERRLSSLIASEGFNRSALECATQLPTFFGRLLALYAPPKWHHIRLRWPFISLRCHSSIGRFKFAELLVQRSRRPLGDG